MGKIDRIGTFLGVVSESTLGCSSNGFPQWVARLTADKKYVNDPGEMEQMKITEPGYVPWEYDESITAFMVLFNATGPLKNYDQLKAAMGWSGDDFQDLMGFTGKRLLFRVEENTYKDQTTLQVNWIDAEDAPPERTLKSVEPNKVAELTAKFLKTLAKPTAPAKPTVAAKPAAAKPPVGKPAAPTATAGASQAAAQPAAVNPPAPATPTESPTTAAPSAAPVEKPKATPPARKTKTPPAPPVATENPAPGLPTSTTKEAAWEYLNEPTVRGANDEGVVAEAWIAACNEVGENVDEAAFTGDMWAKVRNIVLKDLGIVIA